MEFIPNVGVGSVRFGMSPAEVLANFPEGEQYEDWMGGNRNDSLLYRGLIFGFDKCNAVGPLSGSRLIEFTIYGPGRRPTVGPSERRLVEGSRFRIPEA